MNTLYPWRYGRVSHRPTGADLLAAEGFIDGILSRKPREAKGSQAATNPALANVQNSPPIVH